MWFHSNVSKRPYWSFLSSVTEIIKEKLPKDSCFFFFFFFFLSLMCVKLIIIRSFLFFTLWCRIAHPKSVSLYHHHLSASLCNFDLPVAHQWPTPIHVPRAESLLPYRSLAFLLLFFLLFSHCLVPTVLLVPRGLVYVCLFVCVCACSVSVSVRCISSIWAYMSWLLYLCVHEQYTKRIV